MNPRFLPSLFTLIGVATVLILAPTKAFGQREYAACGQTYGCGDIRNISYPFSGAPNRPAYCGYPGFNLSCESNTLLYRYQEIAYRVLAINYTAQTVTVARNDLWDNLCPQTGYRNTSFDFNLFNYINDGGDQNATLFYSCDQVLVTVPNQFSCNVNGTTTNSYFVTTGTNLPSDIGLCSVNIFVPMKNQSLAGTLQTILSEDALRAALRGGFRLRWTAQNALCDGCVQSGGRCGSSTSSPNPTFACYCANRTYPARCNEGSPNNSSQLPIVLPVVGAILAGIGIGWAFFRCKQRRKRQAAAAGAAVEAQGKTKELPTSISSKPLIANASSNLTTSIPSYPSSASTTEFGRSFYFGTQVFTYEELETATENFDSRHELGEGGFGTVYYGRLVDGREVAVKRLYENNFKRVEQFLNEVEILTKLHHKNLVQLYGCTSRRSRELVLVYEYIANGTVADHLHGKLARSGASGLLSWPVRLNIAIETSEALTYLHESDIIHRDVKTNNILLEKNFQVKVADFGLSRLFPNDVTHVSTAPQGTPGYVDPEYYQCYQITNKSDVYSFGVVLIELISSLQAVDTNRHRHDINLANMAINKIQNHSLNELVDKSLGFETDGTVRRMITLVAELAFRCLQHERDMRPSMKEVLETLKGIQNEDLNVQKAEVLDIVIDTAFPPSPDSGVTDKTTSNGSMPSSSDKMIDISAR